MNINENLKNILLPLLILLLTSLSGCGKKEDMVGTIKVVYAGDIDEPVKNAKVELSQNDIKIVGYTNPQGEYQFTFRLKMKLNVIVTKDTSTVTNSPELKGTGRIAMGEYGENSKEKIYLSP